MFSLSSLVYGGSSSEVEEDGACVGYKAPWRGVNQRKPREYVCHGESRKTSERFRTQPVTFAEHQEADRYWSQAHLCMTEHQEYSKCPCDHAREGN